ncbi:hypothetical protein QFC21_000706 [Naganishia friedmannii]|uniref:Uncharacterized protein n=1 Tax=Naganishia friedmannii TaxID=89922 RepID=A0ACC2W689_9TREE|nr:hypothetical protein QFC21_000706 [Naganishia friedmannii]
MTQGMTGQAGQIFPFCRYREGPQQVPMQNLGVNLYTFFRHANHFNVGAIHGYADNELGHGMGESIYIFDDLEAIGGNFTKPKKCAFWGAEGKIACPNWNSAKTSVKFFDPTVFAVGDILPDMTRANLYKDGEPMKA